MIDFPRGKELVQVMDYYEERWRIPMCAGAIDGTHITILHPKRATLIMSTVKVITVSSSKLL